ncbi:MAG: hypothetical protein K8T90_12730 [Planctomycetes bacterium]|nr:hypothetical protein [Planctomycetota bacterium]
MTRTHYPASYLLDGRVRWLLWFDGGDGSDGVVVSAPGRVPSFASLGGLRAFAGRCTIALSSETPQAPCDLDTAERWAAAPPTTLDCNGLLGAWNLLWDVAGSVGDDGAEFVRRHDAAVASDVYERMFWGCNLPSVTPLGEHFVPTWSDDEIATIAGVLREGVRVFREVVQSGDAA